MKKPATPNPTLEQMVKAAHEAGAVISFGLEAHDSFYGQIEEGVREWVRMLRNAGINTTSSCHHDGYIQAQSVDPTTELRTIFNVLHGRLRHYEVMVFYASNGNGVMQSLEIRSPVFRMEIAESKDAKKPKKRGKGRKRNC